MMMMMMMMKWDIPSSAPVFCAVVIIQPVFQNDVWSLALGVWMLQVEGIED